MQRLVMTSILALGMAAGATAQVVSEDTAGSTESSYEKTLEFIGNPVYTSDGIRIGVVGEATTDVNGSRMILVNFDDSFISDYAGWRFMLDDRWKSTGQLEVLWTADQLRSWIDANGAQQSGN
ncbi:hypothetical protein [Marinibacterium profundimaris]|uniref:hypothetical protein n=1 Tax=Marinibacterium profundimaris TaxID=1679460 RepID=UPI00117EA4EF|nr:hypothetical protein [Marinibacterium profundimaris]